MPYQWETVRLIEDLQAHVSFRGRTLGSSVLPSRKHNMHWIICQNMVAYSSSYIKWITKLRDWSRISDHHTHCVLWTFVSLHCSFKFCYERCPSFPGENTSTRGHINGDAELGAATNTHPLRAPNAVWSIGKDEEI